ncbi:MAG: hypothetical protein ACE366_22415 [Bradymonadia bacterium]
MRFAHHSLVLLVAGLCVPGCDDEAASGPGPTMIFDAAVLPPPMTSGGMGGEAPMGGSPMGGSPMGGSPMGGAPEGGAGGVPMGGMPMGGVPEGGAGGDGGAGGVPMGGAGGAPMGGMPMGGDPNINPDCDPRLAAAACPPGQFCRPIPGGEIYQGQCEPGDACTPGAGDCPGDRPYCHLQGGATVCTAAGALQAGERCSEDDRLPQPCAEGLVCNFSVCTPVCDPSAPMCPDNDRCDDISEAVAVPMGLCNPPACSFLTNEGCEADQKCTYAIRQDGRIVGSCRPVTGEAADGEPCQLFPEGGDDCAPGLLCIGNQGGNMVCRTLCDTGAYIDPCPANQACVEALATGGGRVRGVGLCITNP